MTPLHWFVNMNNCESEHIQLLLDYGRFEERKRYAESHALPVGLLHSLSRTYVSLAERITSQPIVVPDRPVESIMATLADDFGLAA